MNDSEQLRAIKIVVDDAVDYGCGLLVNYLEKQISYEDFARRTRIKYRDALNKLDLIVNPMPEPGREGAIVNVIRCKKCGYGSFEIVVEGETIYILCLDCGYRQGMIQPAHPAGTDECEGFYEVSIDE